MGRGLLMFGGYALSAPRPAFISKGKGQIMMEVLGIRGDGATFTEIEGEAHDRIICDMKWEFGLDQEFLHLTAKDEEKEYVVSIPANDAKKLAEVILAMDFEAESSPVKGFVH